MTDRPLVTCLCPTYGRFHRLRDAVACFLLQRYQPRRLLILNDAPKPIAVRVETPRRREIIAQDGWSIEIRNSASRLATLGHKRQALLDAAHGPLVAHWDDDDLYLPWHLDMLAERLEATGVWCVKPGAAWWGCGPCSGFQVKGPCHNVFEGQMLFQRDWARALGGYPPLDSGQAKALLGHFQGAGQLHTWNPPDERISYVYRWADRMAHVSATGNSARGKQTYAASNDDWGPGEPVISAHASPIWALEHLADQFTCLTRGIEQRTNPATADAVKRALHRRPA